MLAASELCKTIDVNLSFSNWISDGGCNGPGRIALGCLYYNPVIPSSTPELGARQHIFPPCPTHYH